MSFGSIGTAGSAGRTWSTLSAARRQADLSKRDTVD